jgi:hypothetical protein
MAEPRLLRSLCVFFTCQFKIFTCKFFTCKFTMPRWISFQAINVCRIIDHVIWIAPSLGLSFCKYFVNLPKELGISRGLKALALLENLGLMLHNRPANILILELTKQKFLDLRTTAIRATSTQISGLKTRDLSSDSTINVVFGVAAFIVGILSVMLAYATWQLARRSYRSQAPQNGKCKDSWSNLNIWAARAW